MSIDNFGLYFKFKKRFETFPESAVVNSLHCMVGQTAVQFNVGHAECYSAHAGHFFVDDSLFERVWNSPARYVERLKHFKFITAPDFSCYSNVPLYLQKAAIYRSRLLTLFFQANGINCVPVIQYSASFPIQDVISEFPYPCSGFVAVRLPGIRHTKFEHELFVESIHHFSGNEILVFVPAGYSEKSLEQKFSFPALNIRFVRILRKFQRVKSS